MLRALLSVRYLLAAAVLAIALANCCVPSASAALVVDFDALDLALSNGANVATWDGRTANSTPTYLTGQTPNGRPAVEFNGTDHFGTGVLSSAAAGDFIILAVLAPQATGGYHNVIDDDDASRPMLWIDSGNTYEMNFGAGSPGSASRPGPVTGAWNILIADSRNGQLYFNSPTVTHTAPAIAWNPGSESFDFFNRDGGQSFQGRVAEFRVYNDAATFGGDFAALYNAMDAKWIQPIVVELPTVPEPSTALLYGVGLAGLAASARRRFSRKEVS